jgi:hypothetical protein
MPSEGGEAGYNGASKQGNKPALHPASPSPICEEDVSTYAAVEKRGEQ